MKVCPQQVSSVCMEQNWTVSSNFLMREFICIITSVGTVPAMLRKLACPCFTLLRREVGRHVEPHGRRPPALPGPRPGRPGFLRPAEPLPGLGLR